MSRVLFGELNLDQPAHLNQGLMLADGCYPIANGYAPFGQFAATSNGILPSKCLGAAAYRTASSTYLFAATVSDIRRYQAGGYTTLITGLSNGLGVTFQPYAALMLATNGSDPVKKFDPASPTTMTNLGGSPPIARYMAVVGGFVVLAYAGGSPRRITWSDQGLPEVWTPGTGEAGVADLSSGGDITAIVGGEYGLVFQENRIVRMDYTASDTIWQFNEIATDVGCIVPGSVATWGKLTFFLSNRGFMVCDGTTVQPIGGEKVDRWFQARANRTYYDFMTAVIDPQKSLYVVTLPFANPATGVLIYNYALSRWSTAKVQLERLFSGLTLATTLEALTALYGSLDAMTVSLDSAAFRGGLPQLLAFDGSHRLGSLSGMPVEATFTDAEREAFAGYRARVRSVRPMTDATDADIVISGRNALPDKQTTTTYATARAGGTFPVRESWNLIQVGVRIPAGASWSFAQGYDIDMVQGGRT